MAFGTQCTQRKNTGLRFQSGTHDAEAMDPLATAHDCRLHRMNIMSDGQSAAKTPQRTVPGVTGVANLLDWYSHWIGMVCTTLRRAGHHDQPWRMHDMRSCWPLSGPQHQACMGATRMYGTVGRACGAAKAVTHRLGWSMPDGDDVIARGTVWNAMRDEEAEALMVLRVGVAEGVQDKPPLGCGGPSRDTQSARCTCARSGL